MRGIGRYCFHLLQTLFERHADHEYVLYHHEGLPFEGLPEPRLGRRRALPGDLPTRRDVPTAVDMDYLTWVNPDRPRRAADPQPVRGTEQLRPADPGLTTA